MGGGFVAGGSVGGGFVAGGSVGGGFVAGGFVGGGSVGAGLVGVVTVGRVAVELGVWEVVVAGLVSPGETQPVSNMATASTKASVETKKGLCRNLVKLLGLVPFFGFINISPLGLNLWNTGGIADLHKTCNAMDFAKREHAPFIMYRLSIHFLLTFVPTQKVWDGVFYQKLPKNNTVILSQVEKFAEFYNIERTANDRPYQLYSSGFCAIFAPRKPGRLMTKILFVCHGTI